MEPQVFQEADAAERSGLADQAADFRARAQAALAAASDMLGGSSTGAQPVQARG